MAFTRSHLNDKEIQTIGNSRGLNHNVQQITMTIDGLGRKKIPTDDTVLIHIKDMNEEMILPHELPTLTELYSKLTTKTKLSSK